MRLSSRMGIAREVTRGYPTYGQYRGGALSGEQGFVGLGGVRLVYRVQKDVCSRRSQAIASPPPTL